MKNVYRALAYLVAALVVVQAAAIAYGVFGLFAWVDKGGTVDKALFTSESALNSVGGVTGFALHGQVGTLILPIAALLFVISSFFAKVPGGIKWAVITFLVMVVQVALGIFSHELAGLGWLHGVNALILFAVAVMSGMRVSRAVAARDGQHASGVAAPSVVA